MIVLGLDLGTKTLGIAISRTGIIANPYKLLRYNNEEYDKLALEVADIIRQENVTEIALGLPKNMNNTCGFATERSQNFKKILEKYVNIPINLIEKRLSTEYATNILLSNDMCRKKIKNVIDFTAAMIILDTYLKKRKANEK